MSIGNYVITLIGLVLFVIGGFGLIIGIMELYESFRKKGILDIKRPIFTEFLIAAFGLAFLFLGFYILYEGYPYSINIILWLIIAIEYMFLIIIILGTLVGDNSMALEKKEFFIFLAISVSVIILTTYFYRATKSNKYYKKIIPHLIANVPSGDSISSIDSTLNIPWPIAVFNINKDTIEVGYGEKKKRTYTIDNDISFRIPVKFLTRNINNLNSIVFLNWQYNILGSNWYKQTIRPIGSSTVFEVKYRQYICEIFVFDIKRNSFIRHKVFKGSLPTGTGNIEKRARGSDPTKEIVNYLKGNL